MHLSPMIQAKTVPCAAPGISGRIASTTHRSDAFTPNKSALSVHRGTRSAVFPERHVLALLAQLRAIYGGNGDGWQDSRQVGMFLALGFSGRCVGIS
jgi:hypothetical protein